MSAQSKSHLHRTAFAALLVLATACATGEPNLSRPPSAQHQLLLELPCRGGVALAPDGTRVATSNGWALEVRAVPGGTKLARHELRLGADAVSGACVAWSPDGRWLAASARGERSVVVVEAQTEGAPARRVDLAHGRATVLAFAHASGELTVGTDQGFLERFDAATGAGRGSIALAPNSAQGPLPVAFAAWTGRDELLLASAGKGGLAAFEPQDGARAWERLDERPLALDATGTRLVTASMDRAEARGIDLADPRSPRVLATVRDPAGDGRPELAAWCGTEGRLAIAFTRSFVLARWLDAEFFTLERTAEGSAALAHAGGVRIGAPAMIAGDGTGRWLAVGASDGASVYDLDGWFRASR